MLVGCVFGITKITAVGWLVGPPRRRRRVPTAVLMPLVKPSEAYRLSLLKTLGGVRGWFWATCAVHV